MNSEERDEGDDVGLNDGSSSSPLSTAEPSSSSLTNTEVGHNNNNKEEEEKGNEEKETNSLITEDKNNDVDNQNEEEKIATTTTADNNNDNNDIEGSNSVSASADAVDDILGGLFEEFGDSIKEISYDNHDTTSKKLITPTNSPKKKKKKKKQVKDGSKKNPSKKKKKRKKKHKDSGIAAAAEEEEERIAGISAKDLEDILMQKIRFRKVLKEQEEQQQTFKRRTSSFFEKMLGKTKTETLEEEKQRQLDELIQNVNDPSLRDEIIGQSQTIEQKDGDMTVNVAANNASKLFKKMLLPESLDDVKERRLRELRQHMTDPQLKEQIVAQSHQIMLKEDETEEIQTTAESLDLQDLIDPKLIRDDDQKREQLQKDLRQRKEVQEQMDEQLKMIDPDFDDEDLLQWQLDALSKYHKDNGVNGEHKSATTKPSSSSSSTLLGLIRQSNSKAGNSSKIKETTTMTESDSSDDDDDDDDNDQQNTNEPETLQEEMERKRIALKLYLKAIDPDLENLATNNNNTQDLLLLQYRMTSKLEEIEEDPSKFGFDGHRLKALKSALGERPLLKKMTTMSTSRNQGVPLSQGI